MNKKLEESVNPEEKIEEINKKYKENSTKGLTTISKTKVDELYHQTIKNLKLENENLKKKRDKYNSKILASDEQRQLKYINSTNEIFNNFRRQMIPHTDEKHIETLLMSIPDETPEKPQPTIIEENPNQAHFFTAEDTLLSKQLKNAALGYY